MSEEWRTFTEQPTLDGKAIAEWSEVVRIARTFAFMRYTMEGIEGHHEVMGGFVKKLKYPAKKSAEFVTVSNDLVYKTPYKNYNYLIELIKPGAVLYAILVMCSSKKLLSAKMINALHMLLSKPASLYGFSAAEIPNSYLTNISIFLPSEGAEDPGWLQYTEDDRI